MCITKKEITNEYFEWLCNSVYSKKFSKPDILEFLHNVDFEYTIGMDANRAEDGISLRYRFCCDRGYDYRMVASYLDVSPCSFLEMLVALAIRCEEHIMHDDYYGDRTAKWFWDMLLTMGLVDKRSGKFNDNLADDILYAFFNREYKRNGAGGLFKTKNHTHDMRSEEIWYQMCTYLNENS